MSQPIEEQARRLEAILPLILRTIYPPREDDPFAELPLMQLRVIRSLSVGERTMSDVAEELGMSASRLAHLVARLESVGLVVKNCHPEDRRVKFLCLSEVGRVQMQTHQSLRANRATEILSQIPPSRRALVMESLEDLYHHAKSAKPVDIAKEMSAL